MRMASHRFAVSILTTVAFVATQIPTTAFAQTTAQAETAFRDGKKLLEQKQYKEACKLLAASYKLDPQPNTELLEGVCYSKLGKTASAYSAFIDASYALPKGGDAQKYAADQAKALESQLLKVTVQFQPVVPEGMAMHFDDEKKPRDKDFVGIEIPLDPGEHDLFVTAPGKHDFTKHFTLGTDNSPHTLIVNMVDKTKAELAADKRTVGGGGQVVVEKPETSWSTVKTVGMIGIVVGGVGLVSAGVSFILTQVFQGNAVTLKNRSSNCPTLSPVPPDVPGNYDSNCQDAISYHQQALAAQTAAIGLAIVGGVIGVTGLIMFVVGGNVTKTPEKPAAAALRLTPWIGPQGAGMGLAGTF
jgi:tetratricopeptide (TPR) repeat protein